MEKILLNIDSRQRDFITYTDSSFFRLDYNNSNSAGTYSNDNFINFKNISYISLASIEIPNSFFTFHQSRSNVSFVVTCTRNVGSADVALTPGTYTIIINNGNYTISELVNAVNVKLNNNGLNVGVIDGVGNITVTNGLKCIVNGSKLISFKNLSNQYTFSIDFSNSSDYNSLGYYLGYRRNSISIGNLGEVFGTAMYDVTGENYIFLRVNDYGNNYINSRFPIRVLAKIILNNSKGNIIYNNGDDCIFRTYRFKQPVDIKKLEIELLDYTGKRLNNIGSDYSITLELGSIYDSLTYKEALNDLQIFDKSIEKLNIAY